MWSHLPLRNFNENLYNQEFDMRVKMCPKQTSLVFKLVMQIHRIDQQKDARFKRDFSVWCTLIMAALLPMKDVCKISMWPHLKPKVVELLLPSAFGDIWGSWGIWDRIHRGREWAERWAPVGMERSTKASVCAGPAQYSLCSSFASQCHHDCGRTPSYRSCAGQMGYHLNCPESPEIRE